MRSSSSFPPPSAGKDEDDRILAFLRLKHLAGKGAPAECRSLPGQVALPDAFFNGAGCRQDAGEITAGELAALVGVGVTGRFVQNCTLSRLGEERVANVAQRPEARLGAGGGPHVIAGQRDVLPAERGDMGQQVIRNGDALLPKLPHVHTSKEQTFWRKRRSAAAADLLAWLDPITFASGSVGAE